MSALRRKLVSQVTALALERLNLVLTDIALILGCVDSFADAAEQSAGRLWCPKSPLNRFFTVYCGIKTHYFFDSPHDSFATVLGEIESEHAICVVWAPQDLAVAQCASGIVVPGEPMLFHSRKFIVL